MPFMFYLLIQIMRYPEISPIIHIQYRPVNRPTKSLGTSTVLAGKFSVERFFDWKIICDHLQGKVF